MPGFKRADLVEMHIMEEEGEVKAGMAANEGMYKTLGKVHLNAGKVADIMTDFFHGVVREKLTNMDIDDLIDVHLEVHLERAIQDMIAKGWGKDRTLEHELELRIRDMASKKIADGYTVEVSVSLRKDGA